MTLPVADDFNRANEFPLAGNWTMAGPNAMKLDNAHASAWTGAPGAAIAPALAAAYWSADAFPADQYAECVVIDDGGSPYPRGGPAVRLALTGAALTGYVAAVANFGGGGGFTTLTLEKYVSDVRTVLATYPNLTVAYGDRIKLTVVGTTLRTYIAGVEIGAAATDPDLSAGAAGMVVEYLPTTGGPTLDDWAADAEGVPPPEPLYGFEFGPATAILARASAITARRARGSLTVAHLARGSAAIHEEYFDHA